MHRLRSFLNEASAEADDEDGDERAEAASEPIDVMPRAGCGDQVVVEVNKKLTLLFVDSQWWMQDAPVDEEVNEGCEVSTRTSLDLELGINLNSNLSKRLVVSC